MLLISLLAITTQPLSFRGGSPANFAQFVETNWKRPAFVAAFRSVPAISMEDRRLLDDFGVWNNTIRLVSARGMDEARAAFRARTWPPYFPFRSGMAELDKFVPLTGLKVVERQGEKLTTKKPVLFEVANIPTLKLAAAPAFHWFFQKYRVGASFAQPISEGEFLQGVADALGGEIVRRGARTFVELNPKLFKDQWITHYEEKDNEPRSKELSRLDREMRQAFVLAIPETAIRSVMQSPDTITRVKIDPNSTAHTAAKAYLSGYGRIFVNTVPSAIESEKRAKAEMLASIDEDKPYYFTIDPQGAIRLSCQGKKGQWVSF